MIDYERESNELSDELLFKAIATLPVEAAYGQYSLSLNREGDKTRAEIKALENEERIELSQSPEDFLDLRAVNNINFYFHKKGFYLTREHVLKAKRRGYNMKSAMLILEYGCNGSINNPDNYHWTDSGITIEKKKIKIKIGDRMGEENAKKLKGWFNSFSQHSLQ